MVTLPRKEYRQWLTAREAQVAEEARLLDKPACDAAARDAFRAQHGPFSVDQEIELAAEAYAAHKHLTVDQIMNQGRPSRW